MRSLLLTGLCCVSVLTGCKLHSVTSSHTPQINAHNLAITHVYKIPSTNQPKSCLTRFNDPQLHQLIAVALTDGPDMRSAWTRIDRARQIAKGTFSALWPSADLKGSIAKDHFSFHGVVPPPFTEIIANQARIENLALNFNYELDLWGKNRETFASSVNESFATHMDLEETQLILSSTIASVYFDLQNNLLQQQLAKENVRLLEELEGIVTDRAKQGVESDIPVKTAISSTQAARLSVDDYHRAEMQARHQLATLMGKNPFNTEIETSKFTYNKHELALPKIIPANLLGHRPDIIATRARAQAAAHLIKVAKAAFFPNINLSGVLSLQSFYFSKLFHIALQTEGVKAALELPIFDAGARKANLGVKRAEYELAVNQYNQTILNALREVSDQMTTLQTLNKQVNSQEKAVHATETNYRLFRSRYASGVIDYVQLLEIKQLVVQQKSLLISLQTRQKQAFVALLAALGGEVSL
ncbi:MAG: Outer membrane protein OprM [Legionella sp.]|uniref:efflux transporter outer membrane subunit n=1 Tax=Legionella sp. TaxID=459 RepID=UPI003D0C40E3